MPTKHQQLGEAGEIIVAKSRSCPKCKRAKTLKRLPTNFKCADVVCDFCGYLAQIKTTRVKDIERLPDRILGAAWGPQQDRMKAGIYFPMFIVLMKDGSQDHSVFYLSADLQPPEMFLPRRPLSKSAKRAGWQGFVYDMSVVKESVVRLA